MTPYSLVNAGGLAKPVTVLIEKISNAVGTLWEPKQIRRVAQAEADAAMILAKKRLEIDEIHRRAAERFVDEETRKQVNMERIVDRAIQDVLPNAPTEDVEEDWIASFFDKCRSFSDDEMQDLWSRILSDEANSPGSFSRKTVNLVADLDKPSAELFRRVCSFGWQFGELLSPLVYDFSEPLYTRFRLTLFSLGQLESIGLIRIGGASGFQLYNQPKEIVCAYQGRQVLLRWQNDTDNTIEIGKVLMTPSGTELSRIVQPIPIDGFFEFVYDRWASESLVPARGDQS